MGRLLEDDSLDALLGSMDQTPPRTQETFSRRYQALQCAVQYLRDHADEPVSLRRLCQASGVSDRALEIAFKQTFDLTPKAYITLSRLHGVRRALRTAGPADCNVTEVATRWGFLHLGRFAGYYLKLFGESPRDTLYHRIHRERFISVQVRPLASVVGS